MNMRHWIWVALGLALAGCATPRYAVDERVESQTVELKIRQVLQAREGDAVFRAYIVNWQEQAVAIVSDEAYAEGDVVPVRVTNSPFPNGAAPHRLLSFGIVPSMSQRLLPPVDPDWVREERVRSRDNFEKVALNVVEVFAAHDGNALFRAYRVKWKGQDVVVIDTLANAEARKGGIISVLVSKRMIPPGREPAGGEAHHWLRFILAATPFEMDSDWNPPRGLR